MVAISTNGKGPDIKRYNEIVDGINANNFNPMIRFILEQKNYTRDFGLAGRRAVYKDGTPDQLIEDLLNKEQSENLVRIYITAARLLGNWADKGNFANLDDVRPAVVLDHRGWYLSERILPKLLRRAMPDFAKKYPNSDYQLMRAFYDGFAAQATPEFNTVQSILTGEDFEKYIKPFRDNKFVHPNTTPASYYADAQKVFEYIADGRSVVLMHWPTLQKLQEFARVFGDEKSPYHKPEYNAAIERASALTIRQWDAERARLANLRAPRTNPTRASAPKQSATTQQKPKPTPQQWQNAARKFQEKQQRRPVTSVDNTPDWLRKLRDWFRD